MELCFIPEKFIQRLINCSENNSTKKVKGKLVVDINWDLTMKCDLRCMHCGAIDLIEDKSELTSNEISIITGNIVNYSSSVTLVGGEPMLSPHIKDILSLLSKYEVSVRIITNGQADIEKYIEIVQQYRIDSITVSIDGTQKENDCIRGHGTWNKAKQCLEMLLKLKDDGYINSVNVNTVINQINKDCITALMNDIFNDRKLSSLQISPVSFLLNAKKNQQKLFISDNNLVMTYQSIAKYVTENNLDNEVQISTVNAFIDDWLFLSTGYRNNSNNECGALYESAYIDNQGFFYPCRTYKGKGIDLKKSGINYEDILMFYTDFIQLQQRMEYENISNDCMYYHQCDYCPINELKCDKLCSVISGKINEMIQSRAWKNPSKAYFYKMGKACYGYFLSKLEKVEYTIEGMNIHKALHNFHTIDDIAKQTDYEPDIIKAFLLSELKENRVICCI